MSVSDRGSRDFFGIGPMLGLTGTARETDHVIDRRTAGPQDRRTAGPQDRRTAGPRARVGHERVFMAAPPPVFDLTA